jgi:hypothetical protein
MGPERKQHQGHDRLPGAARDVLQRQSAHSAGSIRDFRNRSVTADGPSQYRVVDEFTNGQISDGHTSYTLRQVDADHIVVQSPQGAVTLQRCK